MLSRSQSYRPEHLETGSHPSRRKRPRLKIPDCDVYFPSRTSCYSIPLGTQINRLLVLSVAAIIV